MKWSITGVTSTNISLSTVLQQCESHCENNEAQTIACKQKNGTHLNHSYMTTTTATTRTTFSRREPDFIAIDLLWLTLRHWCNVRNIDTGAKAALAIFAREIKSPRNNLFRDGHQLARIWPQMLRIIICLSIGRDALGRSLWNGNRLGPNGAALIHQGRNLTHLGPHGASLSTEEALEHHEAIWSNKHVHRAALPLHRVAVALQTHTRCNTILISYSKKRIFGTKKRAHFGTRLVVTICVHEHVPQ